MIVRIDPGSTVPLYEQIASAVEIEVSTGRLQPGASLPAARHLAAALDVNMHTVLKAYERLRLAGVVDIRRGRSGAVVAPSTSRMNQSEMSLASMIDVLVVRAKKEGIERQRLFELIGESW
jgi:GntR family transcriptional regulator